MPKKLKSGVAEASRDFSAILQSFKRKAVVEDVICLMSNEEHLDRDSLLRLLIAWPKVHRDGFPLERCPIDEEEGQWKWLWRMVSYDIKELRKTAGVGDNCEALLGILIGNRLIYPDGSISDWAAKVVRQFIKTRLSV